MKNSKLAKRPMEQLMATVVFAALLAFGDSATGDSRAGGGNLWLTHTRTISAEASASSSGEGAHDEAFDEAVDREPFDSTVVASASVGGGSGFVSVSQQSEFVGPRLVGSGQSRGGASGTMSGGEGKPESGSATGESRIEVTFTLSAVTQYTASGFVAQDTKFFGGNSFGRFTLVGPDGVIIDEIAANCSDCIRTFDEGGPLTPGDYSLTVRAYTSVSGGPGHADGDATFGFEFALNLGGATVFVDRAASGANTGESWADAFVDLQDALQLARDEPVVEEIRVAAGTYRPAPPAGNRTISFELVPNVSIYGGFPPGGGDFEERDPDLHETVLSGDLNGDDQEGFVNDAENTQQVVAATDPGIDAMTVLDGVTITGGNANGVAPNDSAGGMFFDGGASPTVRNCRVVANRSTHDAGGVAIVNSSPDFIDCEILENLSDGPAGGMNFANSSSRLYNCTIARNRALRGGGFADYIMSRQQLVNCLIVENMGFTYGGGFASISDPILTNCTLAANDAPIYPGGWIGAQNGTLTVTNCVVWGNGNGADQIILAVGTPPSRLTIDYSCVQGWTGEFGGVGNTGADPVFADPGAGDYRLQITSPVIDAGDNDAVPEDVFDLDGDGFTDEPVPFDLDWNARFVDVPSREDTGQGNPPLVDMGAYEARAIEAVAALVVRLETDETDVTQELQPSDSAVPRGSRFFVELWASDTGADLTGLVSVYVDLSFTPEAVQAIAIDHRSPFNLFGEGDIDNVTGIISGLGGTDQNFDCIGIQPNWVRVAVVEFEALCDLLAAEFVLSDSPNEMSACAIGAIDPATVAFGAESLAVEFDCTYDLDGSGFVNAGDLGLFAGCWLQSEGDPDYDVACDFDCSGTVAAGDLGWFAGGWLSECEDITDDELPPCRCGTPQLVDGNVEIGWEVVNTDAIGSPTLVDLYVRDTDPRSRGLSAVYVDVRLDGGTIDSVLSRGPFSLLTTGRNSSGRARRLGGATLEAGVAVGTWTPFARLRVTGSIDALVIAPVFDGIGALARGTIKHDRVKIIGLVSP